MSLFPWALFRTTKSAVKMHTLLDLRGCLFGRGRSKHRHHLRPNCLAHWHYKQQGLSRASAPYPLQRPRNRQDAGVTDQHFTLPAATLCALYKARWQVELFFKWIKQYLRIKKFYGNSENAVKIANLMELLVGLLAIRLSAIKHALSRWS